MNDWEKPDPAVAAMADETASSPVVSKKSKGKQSEHHAAVSGDLTDDSAEERNENRSYRYPGARNASFSSAGSGSSIDVYEDVIGKERVTIDEAFEKVGGFGTFQKFSAVMNCLANMGAALCIYSFSFLEKEPVFECQLGGSNDEAWTHGDEDNTMRDEYCSGNYNC